MKLLNRGQAAFTLMELTAIIVIAFIAAVLFLPSSHSRSRPVQINCVNDLKQIGISFRLWSGDNGDMYPMRFFTNSVGAQLFADGSNSFRYFQAMSNELSTPKIVVCPSDKRIPATNFGKDFDGNHVSFFIGLQADETRPNSFLAGDRNIVNGQKPLNGILEMTTNQDISWTKELHNHNGNVGLADGSVQKTSNTALKKLVTSTGLATNRLLLPNP